MFRLRSVRLSKHKARCNAPLWSSGHRASSQLHQHNQQGGPARLQRWLWLQPGLPAFYPAPPFPSRYPLGSSATAWKDRKRERERRTERKAGTTCSSWLVRTAGRRQPKGMENVCAALSGLHEVYMTCYVKMLPVYCAYHALFFLFFPFFFFL